MKTSLWIAIAVLAAVVLTGAVTAGQMHRVSERYVSAAEELWTLTAAGDWQRAAQTAHSYLEDWRALVPVLQMLINHDDTDSVTLALVTLEAAIAAGDQAGCLTACAELRENAQHLYHRDAFTWANVL